MLSDFLRSDAGSQRACRALRAAWRLPNIIAMYFAPGGSRTTPRSHRLLAMRLVFHRAPAIQSAAQTGAPAKEIPPRDLRPGDGPTERTDRLRLGPPGRPAGWPAAKLPASRV